MKKTLGIVNFSVERRVSILMLCLIILVFGFMSLSRLGLDMLPDITFPMVSVITQYPGAAPEEVEQMVTIPLEGRIASVNRVKKVDSWSAEGYSAINVEFEWGTNLDFAAQEIKDNIDFIRDYLPENMRQPVVYKFNTSQIPVMFMGVSGIENTYELRKFLDDNVTERIQRLDGVAQAAVFGGKEREIRVELDLAKIQARGLSITDVVNTLPTLNLNLPAGYFEGNQTDYLLRSIGEFNSIEEIRNSIIGSAPNGTPVMLRDISVVKDTFKEKRSIWRMDNEESVFLILYKRSGSNTLKVSEIVNKEFKSIKEKYPHISFIPIFDQGEPVKNVTSGTTSNALIGGLLAIAFMWIFLLNIRPTLAIAVAIPLSVITTFIAIYLAGFTLNLMTLGGLALGVGMLVDNAIVVIENIYRHLEQGKDRNDASKTGASEVAMAITASTFTTIVVFLPLLFSTGLAGQLTKGLALTIIFALFSSLIVALTIVPMLASLIFKKQRTAESSKWFIPIRDGYAKILGTVLNHPWITTFTVIILLAGSITMAIVSIDSEFMPEDDGSMFILNMDLPVGTPLAETDRISKQICDFINSLPEVKMIGESIGRDEQDADSRATGPHQAQFFIRLHDAKERKRTQQEIQDVIRNSLPELRDTHFKFQSMGMMGGDGKPVTVKIYGRDLGTLEEISDKIANVMHNIKGLKDIETSFSKGRPEFHVKIDRHKALMYGLVPAHIQNAIEAANLGKVSTRLRTGEEEIDIRIILDKKYRDNMDWLKLIPIKTPVGKVIPLSQVVKIESHKGPTGISRDSKFRAGTVDANLSEIALGKAVNTLRKEIKPIEAALPDGYSISFKGQFEDMQESFGQLALGLLLAILLVYMVMAAQFESLSHPFIIMFTFPLAIIGVIWILILTGKTFSLVTFVGLIILSGIAVNNGIVLIDYVNQLRKNGMAIKAALVEAGRTRIRPVLITAGTTIIGMLPMAVTTSEGSNMRSPMALTVIGGLISSTFLTLFFIPVMYLFVNSISTKIKNLVKNVIH